MEVFHKTRTEEGNGAQMLFNNFCEVAVVVM